MLSVANAATPPTAASVVVPARVAPGIPVTGEMATVTLAAKSETGFPPASSAVTCTAGVIVLPAVVLVGFAGSDRDAGPQARRLHPEDERRRGARDGEAPARGPGEPRGHRRQPVARARRIDAKCRERGDTADRGHRRRASERGATRASPRGEAEGDGAPELRDRVPAPSPGGPCPGVERPPGRVFPGFTASESFAPRPRPLSD